MANATAQDNQLDTTLRPGEILDGKYRVDYLVGQGGMAAVWAGTNERTGKRVALKMLLQSLASTPAAAELFRREGLAASRIDHPNVVTIFDVIDHQGVACIVMELLTGEPLDRHLGRVGTLTMSEACALLLPAMRGVSAAHAHGVIHRDLKPQNIFICVGPDGRPVTTKVLDFGISLIAERALDRAAGPLSGVLLGTPAYMAPEQIAASEGIDERADVYGFGVLFYEALGGCVPFAADPGPQLYESILNEAPTSLGQLRPDLPLGIVHVVDTALAKEPAQRYKSLEAMIGAIEDEISPATPPPRSLSPAAGVVPAELARDGRVTPSQAIVRYESGEHQSTRFLVNFPLQAEPSGRRSGQTYLTAADAGGAVPEGEASERQNPQGEIGRRLGLGSGVSSLTMRIPRRLVRAMLGAGAAGLAGGMVFLVWSLTVGNADPAAGLPATVVQPTPVIVPLTPSPSPAPTGVAPSEPVAEPASLAPLPAAAEGEAAGRPERNVRSRGAANLARDAEPALREESRAAKARRPSGIGPKGASARVSPRDKLNPSLGSGTRRAGTLSAEDF